MRSAFCYMNGHTLEVLQPTRTGEDAYGMIGHFDTQKAESRQRWFDKWDTLFVPGQTTQARLLAWLYERLRESTADQRVLVVQPGLVNTRSPTIATRQAAEAISRQGIGTKPQPLDEHLVKTYQTYMRMRGIAPIDDEPRDYHNLLVTHPVTRFCRFFQETTRYSDIARIITTIIDPRWIKEETQSHILQKRIALDENRIHDLVKVLKAKRGRIESNYFSTVPVQLKMSILRSMYIKPERITRGVIPTQPHESFRNPALERLTTVTADQPSSDLVVGEMLEWASLLLSYWRADLNGSLRDWLLGDYLKPLSLNRQLLWENKARQNLVDPYVASTRRR